MVHVDDVAEALVLAADKAAANGRVFIVTDGEEYSTRQISEWIYGALGRRAPSWSVPLSVLRAAARVGDGVGRVTGRPFVFDSPAFEKLLGSACYDCSLIRDELGYRPRRSLRDALPEIVRAQLNAERQSATTACN
jgi:nucleoside-diphosphate-sugar epimerase